MHDEPQKKTERAENWLAAIVLSVAHLLAFGMLYLVLVQLSWSFQDFYKLVGAKLTPEFERIAVASAFIAVYTPIVLLVIAVDIFVVFRLAYRGSRWTSAYSHAVLLCLGFTGFVWTAWSVEPMAGGVPGAGNPPVVIDAKIGSVVAPIIGLREIAEASEPFG